MKVTENDAPILAHSATAFAAATADTLKEARDRAPRGSTGRYSGTLELVNTVGEGERLSTTIGSPLPYGGAVEHGADVGDRRGPHMAGAHTTQMAVSHFGEHMDAQLRKTPL